MKVDAEGNVYCTGPAGLHVIAPSGQLLGRIKVPGHCTNMAWGDADWRTMYVTTFTSQVFRFRLGVPGVPVSLG
jgi:gluconolactonase